MTDHLSPEGRSRNMASIRSRDTKPEMQLRQRLWEKGVRGWRCHRRGLPGRPDLSWGKWRIAVFVDGAFWHGHPDYVRPNASQYWVSKIKRTQERDREITEALEEADWTVLRFWDFEIIADVDRCANQIAHALSSRKLGSSRHIAARQPRRGAM